MGRLGVWRSVGEWGSECEAQGSLVSFPGSKTRELLVVVSLRWLATAIHSRQPSGYKILFNL